MAGLSFAGKFDRDKRAQVADGLAIAVAISLPWSTSGTSILAVLWLISLVPVLDWGEVRREDMTPAGGWPLLLFFLGALGMLWADASWADRLKGFDSFLKLALIPILFVQFRHSERGMWVLAGYGLSCVGILLLSSMFWIWPSTVFLRSLDQAVPVKNAATQSGEFVTCIFCFLYLGIECFERRRWLWLIGLLAVVLGMLANIFYLAVGRTALVVMLVLLVLLAIKKLNLKGMVILLVSVIALGTVGWYSSPYLRNRTTQIWTDLEKYRTTDAKNASGERVEFLRKSIEFVGEAPIFGHGVGSIGTLFAKSAVNQTGAAGSATTNPHNQTFAVAIQLGLVGAVVLWAMWITHLLLFRGNGLVEWVGLVVVVQNIVGSVFNSHLFDFAQGWVYVLGVGVAGGMVMKKRAAKEPAGAAA